jgi:hypothetical protein
MWELPKTNTSIEFYGLISSYFLFVWSLDYTNYDVTSLPQRLPPAAESWWQLGHFQYLFGDHGDWANHHFLALCLFAWVEKLGICRTLSVPSCCVSRVTAARNGFEELEFRWLLANQETALGQEWTPKSKWRLHISSKIWFKQNMILSRSSLDKYANRYLNWVVSKSSRPFNTFMSTDTLQFEVHAAVQEEHGGLECLRFFVDLSGEKSGTWPVDFSNQRGDLWPVGEIIASITLAAGQADRWCGAVSLHFRRVNRMFCFFATVGRRWPLHLLGKNEKTKCHTRVGRWGFVDGEDLTRCLIYDPPRSCVVSLSEKQNESRVEQWDLMELPSNRATEFEGSDFWMTGTEWEVGPKCVAVMKHSRHTLPRDNAPSSASNIGHLFPSAGRTESIGADANGISLGSSTLDQVHPSVAHEK